MFSGESASCICRVTSRSCWEGKATPLGWLWARIMLLAPAYRAFSTTWRTLTGEAANDAVATLLDHATLKSADMSAKKQTLTATLTNGLKLQLGVSGDTVSACGGWSCPEFFEAFESGL